MSYPEKIAKVGFTGNIFYKAIYLTRDKFEETLNKTYLEPYASFAAGITLGSRRNIPDSLLVDFNRTGTTHIIAVSGYNVTIIIANLGILFGLFSRRLKFWGSIVVIIVFVVMTGAVASVVRAGILAGLVAFGRYEGRRIQMTILLLLVAAIMLLFHPYALKFDISFQLSFLAFAGLVYLGPIIANWKLVRVLPGIIRTSLSDTMAAQIMVLPILIYYFGRVSIVAPIVNILVLWLIPAAMGLVFFSGILGLIFQGMGQAVAYIGYFVLKYIIVVVESFSRISWASWEWKTSDWWWMVLFYALIGLFIYKTRKKPFKDMTF